jgi:agmatine deiminase
MGTSKTSQSISGTAKTGGARAEPRVLSSTPRERGYRFPAEWERQRAVWFSWPRPEGISFPGKYGPVPETLCRIMHAIMDQSGERVEINVPNENYEEIVRGHLEAAKVPGRLVRELVGFHFVRTNESWCRDHGPAFVVKRGKLERGETRTAIVDWGFNAWGGKYPPFDDDDAVPTRLAAELGLPVFYPVHARGGGVKPPGDGAGRAGKLIVMEGGAVEFNGRGTVLTTASCLLNRNRNPKMTKGQIETALKDYYGQTHVCWLGEGIVGDDTDGHIDDLARFLDAETIAVAIERDREDANYEILHENRRRVEELRDQDGEPFRIVEVPMPGRIEHDGERLPATYLNFLFVNGAVLVPTFGNAKQDARGLAALQAGLADHRVVGIDCRELIWGLGAIHCLTQQQPA